MKKQKKPHILLFMSDEHRPDVLGIEGNTVIRTPNLDQLAATGTYFRNAYCTCPVCVPGRQSFLAGKLPRTIDCLGFGDPFDSDIMTFPGQLARYGYQTTAIGKMHFEDVDQMHGWLERPIGDMSVRITPPLAEDADVEIVTKQEKEAKGMGFWGPAKEVRNARAIGEHDSKRGKDLQFTESACDYLKSYFADVDYDRPKDDKPLCLAVSLTTPHYPYQCSKEELEYYIRRVSPFMEKAPNDHPCNTQYSAEIGKDVKEREVVRATAAYYGQVEFLDKMIGKVLDTLDYLDVADDFIIMYWSDHGEMLGQHGLWEKKQFYDGSARVPLLIYDPNNPKGEIRDEVVSLLDLFPTICDYARAAKPDDLEGNSLVPLLNDTCNSWRNEAISELWKWYHGNGGFMIRKDNLKYVRYHHPDYPEQLFDMDNDPDEKTNLIDHPKYQTKLEELRTRGDELKQPDSLK